MNNVYGYVTEKIIGELEKGIIPWQKPWINHPKVNYVTGKRYSGINKFLLDKSGEYLTFLQCKELGGKVKKGAKSSMVIFYKPIVKEDAEAEEIEVGTQKKKFVLRYYNVFHIDDCEGITSKMPKFENENLLTGEEILQRYTDCPTIIKDSSQAYYSPLLDVIGMPDKNQFENMEKYYSTLFHEMVHSTGSEKRLNRKGVRAIDRNHKEQYSYEELVAEIGTAMLCSDAGLESPFTNSVAYIGSWLKVLKNDKTMIVKASSESEKAVKYIMGNNEGEALIGQ